jgi:hypothetical protein
MSCTLRKPATEVSALPPTCTFPLRTKRWAVAASADSPTKEVRFGFALTTTPSPTDDRPQRPPVVRSSGLLAMDSTPPISVSASRPWRSVSVLGAPALPPIVTSPVTSVIPLSRNASISARVLKTTSPSWTTALCGLRLERFDDDDAAQVSSMTVTLAVAKRAGLGLLVARTS